MKTIICCLLCCAMLMTPLATPAQEDPLKDIYLHAFDLFNKGELAQAIAVFESLKDYKDAAENARFCRAWLAGEEGDFDAAINLFTELGSFNGSPDYVTYYKGRALEDQGKAWEAFQMYYKAHGVLDSRQRMDSIIDATVTPAPAPATTPTPTPTPTVQPTVTPEPSSKNSTIPGDDYPPVNENDFEYISLDDGTLGIIRYSGDAQKVRIPAKINGIPVTVIKGEAFNNLDNLQGVFLEEGIKIISTWAFSNCTNLSEVILPDSLETIEAWAFHVCSSLTSILLPDNLKPTDYNPFPYSDIIPQVHDTNPRYEVVDGVLFDKIDKILVSYPATATRSVYEVPEGIVSIAVYAFNQNTSLKQVILPSSLREIGGIAFAGCANLSTINLPEGLNSIGYAAFRDCICLDNINLPSSLVILENEAFFGCKNLSDINLNEGLETIGEDAFAYCTKLKSIELPASLASIPGNPFRGTFTNITVNQNNPFFSIVDRALMDKRSDTLVSYNAEDVKGVLELPDFIKHIGDGAIDLRPQTNYNYPGNLSVEKVLIPDGVLSIGNWGVTVSESVAVVSIPNSVTAMGDGAVYGSSTLVLEMASDSYAAEWAKKNYDLNYVNFTDGTEKPSAPDIVGKWGNYETLNSDGTSFNFSPDSNVEMEFTSDGKFILYTDGKVDISVAIDWLENWQVPESLINAALPDGITMFYHLTGQRLSFSIVLENTGHSYGYEDTYVKYVKTEGDKLYMMDENLRPLFRLTRIQ